MTKLLLMLSFVSFAFAGDLSFAPAGFQDDGREFVFVDLERTTHNISYDIRTNKAMVISELTFRQVSPGYPLFDMVEKATSAMIEGEKVDILPVKMPNGGHLRAVAKKMVPGTYQLKLSHPLKELVRFNGEQVRSAFWMSDLKERSYLEKYLPTNLEYDHYQMTFDVKILGSSLEHNLMINCNKTVLGFNHFQAECPRFYAASGLFFHLFEKGRFSTLKKIYKSIDGRSLPITVYSGSSNLNSFMSKALEVMAELERDYGVWPHEQLLIYGAGSGGMEYSGATMTSLWALGHEMHHSYFARGMTPARGNAGWLDEALASWRDEGYQTYSKWRLRKTSMGGHSPYRRSTDRLAYTAGEKFMGYLNGYFKEQGGLLPFLKELNSNYIFQPMTTQIFEKELGLYFGQSVSPLFQEYIKNQKNGGIFNGGWFADPFKQENPYHPVLTKEELLELI